MNEPRATIRLDKWLWFARFFKTRGLSAKLVTGGHVRVNSDKVSKASFAIGAGDTLTFPQANRIRVVRIIDVGSRRGPATEAQALYDDLTPEPTPGNPTPTEARKGRPTRRDRQVVRKFKEGLE